MDFAIVAYHRCAFLLLFLLFHMCVPVLSRRGRTAVDVCCQITIVLFIFQFTFDVLGAQVTIFITCAEIICFILNSIGYYIFLSIYFCGLLDSCDRLRSDHMSEKNY
jgi:hypothetical protein